MNTGMEKRPAGRYIPGLLCVQAQKKKRLAYLSGFFLILYSFTALLRQVSAQPPTYCWQSANYDPAQSIAERIPVPAGFERVNAPPGSFAAWLRNLPLEKSRPPVHLYDGREKWNQDVHYAVVDIDTGTRDLQQCADAVMRLRAEYLFSIGAYARIHFNFTSGARADFTKWADGYRPKIRNGSVSWAKTAKKDFSHRSFRLYMDLVFSYAGTLSLSRKLQPVRINGMRSGDVLIVGGSPGHAVIVVDMAEGKEAGGKLFLIAQSYMPAQDVHVLKNLEEPGINPWYEARDNEAIITPEWTFGPGELKRFTN